MSFYRLLPGVEFDRSKTSNRDVRRRGILVFGVDRWGYLTDGLLYELVGCSGRLQGFLKDYGRSIAKTLLTFRQLKFWSELTDYKVVDLPFCKPFTLRNWAGSLGPIFDQRSSGTIPSCDHSVSIDVRGHFEVLGRLWNLYDYGLIWKVNHQLNPTR